MENFNRKRQIQVFILLVCCLLAPVWSYSQRTVAVERVLKSAERWKDVRELTGKNDHPMITKSMKLCGLRGDKGYPWCASSQADIFYHAGISAPLSAAVTGWFKSNVVWKKEWGEMVYHDAGMVGALYYAKLGRYGHIVLIVGEDKNNFYCMEGNTNNGGSREGDGFYRTIRSKKSIAALADYCLSGKDFINEYDNYLQKIKP